MTICFWKATLDNASFKNSSYIGGNFSEASMTYAHLYGFKCTSCHYFQTNLFKVNLSNAHFVGGSSFKSADLRQATLHKTLFNTGIDFENANMMTIEANSARFNDCSFRWTQLSESSLENTTFEQCEFDSTRMINVKLNQTSQIVMTRLNGTKLNITNCVFFMARFVRVNSMKIQTSKSDFTKAHVADEQFKQTASLAGSTLPNGTVVSF
ncbi:hypothetical protein I4U23_004867 [Adineta vaga]|nr:hypothetical protein I4U23_004867 [Adineta vaga]